MHALGNVDVPPARQARQPAEPALTQALHGGLKVADKEDIDSAPFGRHRRGLCEDVLQAEQVGLPGVGNAVPEHDLDAGPVGEDGLTEREEAALKVPLELPVGRQGDERHGGVPKACWNRRVVQLEDDEIGPPAGGEPRKERFPGIGGSEHQVGAGVGVEGETAARLAVGLPALGASGRDGTDEIT